MAALVIRQFLGSIPAITPQLLPPGAAQVATNVNLEYGDIRPLKTSTAVVTPTKSGTKQTIYRYGESLGETQHWWTFTTDVDIVRAPIDGDTSERTYYTGDGYPKKTDNSIALSGGTDYPTNAYRLGMPIPITSSSTAVVSGTATSETDIATTVAYVVTYVSGWGEESAPSAPIGPASFKPGQTVNVSGLPLAPTGNYNLSGKRLYRSNTGTTGTAYQFLADLSLAATSYSDTATSSQLGELIQTMGWEPPPEDGFGMTLGANGNCIILSGRTIYPSIPFVLYAYPPEYQLSTESDLVGAGAFGQSFAILTKSNPYILHGIDPASYSMQRLHENQACVSKRSIVSMRGGVVYASPDGLYVIDSSGMNALTKTIFTREQWQAFKPESIHAYEMDGRYHMFYDTGTVQGHLIFDFGNTPYVVASDQYCTAAYTDPLRDSMYMAVGSNIVKWNSGSALTYTWKSGEYRTPWYANYGYGKIEASAYPVTFKLYGDGVLKHTQTVANNRPFRLPSMQVRSANVEVSGTAQITAVTVAETGAEISKA